MAHKIRIEHSQTQKASAEQRRLQMLSDKWEERNTHPHAYVPYEVRREGGVVYEEAVARNQEHGQFASQFLKQELEKIIQIRLKEGGPPAGREKLVAVGYGLGYDSGYSPTDKKRRGDEPIPKFSWLKEASLAGLQVWWFDVSPTAIKTAQENLAYEYIKLSFEQVEEGGKKLVFPFVYPKPADIEMVLTNPSEYNLDPSKIRLLYLCRVIGCIQPRENGENTMTLLGRSLGGELDTEKTHRIVLVTDLMDYNRHLVDENYDPESHTTILYEKEEILSHLAIGAGRSVVIDSEASIPYWNKISTAMSFRAE